MLYESAISNGSKSTLYGASCKEKRVGGNCITSRKHIRFEFCGMLDIVYTENIPNTDL